MASSCANDGGADTTVPPVADRPRAPVLVVGVGSELRSDDAAGRRVAELVAGEHPAEQVEVHSVHQLAPELAESMLDRQLVVVVDASVSTDRVEVATIAGDDVPGAMSHHLGVAALVRLAGQLGGRPTRVLTVAVPAHDLALGTALSPRTVEAVHDALACVLELCAGVVGRPRPRPKPAAR
jgi:hydrogenase maturation protease